MSSETALTGHEGKFYVGSDQVARATQWNMSFTLATKSEWGDSDSEGWTNRAKGRKDATFTAEGKYDTEDEIFDLFMPGDIVSSQLYMDRTANGLFWEFPRALCDDFGMMVDMNSMEVIGWTSKWGTDGKAWYPGEEGERPSSGG